MKSFWKEAIFVLFILLAASAGYTQVTATAKLDTNAMTIGDQVHLDLKLSLPAGYQFSWPALGDTVVKDMEILSRSKIDTVVSPDKKSFTVTQRLRLTSFDSGEYKIPPVQFLYRHLPDTSIRIAESPQLMLVVHTVKVDTTRAIKPVKEPMNIPYTFMELLPWILAGVGVILLVIAILYYLWKKKKKQPVFQLRPKVRLKPEEMALMEIENLRVKKLWQNGRIKEYHTELTEILRKYIEESMNIMALEKTSAEIIFDLKKQGKIQQQIMEKLEEVLTTADMVKFAKAQPLPDEHEQSMQYSIDFVKETTPVAGTETKSQTEI